MPLQRPQAWHSGQMSSTALAWWASTLAEMGRTLGRDTCIDPAPRRGQGPAPRRRKRDLGQQGSYGPWLQTSESERLVMETCAQRSLRDLTAQPGGGGLHPYRCAPSSTSTHRGARHRVGFGHTNVLNERTWSSWTPFRNNYNREQALLSARHSSWSFI